MDIFIGNLIGFVVIAFIIWKWVVPPVRTMMKKQQDAVRTALAESAEAAKVTDEARQDSERIEAQLTEQAGVDAERIKAQGAQQVQFMRQQLIRQLRQGLGNESIQKADELVRAHVADPAAQAATVDRFLDDLDQMAPSEAVVETAASARLRAA